MLNVLWRKPNIYPSGRCNENQLIFSFRRENVFEKVQDYIQVKLILVLGSCLWVEASSRTNRTSLISVDERL